MLPREQTMYTPGEIEASRLKYAWNNWIKGPVESFKFSVGILVIQKKDLK